MTADSSETPDLELREAARRGDDDAFRRLVEPHRGELHAHCDRLLASVHDADDVLQDTLMRAWRGLLRFEGRSSLRSWLYRIATNACLDRIAQRPKRALPVDFGPTADPHGGPSESSRTAPPRASPPAARAVAGRPPGSTPRWRPGGLQAFRTNVSSHTVSGPGQAARSFKSQTPTGMGRAFERPPTQDLDATNDRRAVRPILHQGNLWAISRRSRS